MTKSTSSPTFASSVLTPKGACKEEKARIVLGTGVAKEPERNSKTLDSHLGRARWMIEHAADQDLREMRASSLGEYALAD